MKIAIDGPAGSGKSSTARAVAAELGYRHLDSGAFYRALTYAALDAGIAPERWADLDADGLARLGVDALPVDGGYTMRVGGRPVGEELRTPAVNAEVSRMAAVPAVRAWLLGALRRAGEGGGVVADGRDIGTVVFPDAELKVFLVADAAERARRRLAEQGSGTPSEAELRDEIGRQEERDRRDSSRAVAPLRRAPDAVQLDTTALGFDDQVQAILDLARVRLRG
jgi:CMP/dCMP kinase